jgi:hypothetical protein
LYPLARVFIAEAVSLVIELPLSQVPLSNLGVLGVPFDKEEYLRKGTPAVLLRENPIKVLTIFPMRADPSRLIVLLAGASPRTLELILVTEERIQDSIYDFVFSNKCNYSGVQTKITPRWF